MKAAAGYKPQSFFYTTIRLPSVSKVEINQISAQAPTVAHQFPANRAVYFIIYTRILGKSYGKLLWDFIGNLALIYINMWSSGLILECRSRRIKSRRWWTPVEWKNESLKSIQKIWWTFRKTNGIPQNNTILNYKTHTRAVGKPHIERAYQNLTLDGMKCYGNKMWQSPVALPYQSLPDGPSLGLPLPETKPTF